MNRRRMIVWMAVGGIFLAALVAFVLKNRAVRVQLPGIVRDEHLPSAFHQALQDARERVRVRPDDAAEIRKLAQLYHANRFFQEARLCYRLTATTAAGLSAKDHYYLADIDHNEEALDDAQAELRDVILSEPDYLPARIALADSLFKSGRDAFAAIEFEAVLTRHADQPQAVVGLARLELKQGNDTSAFARLEKLLATHPETTSAAALLAQILDRRGDKERAAAMTQWSRQKNEPVPADLWMTELFAHCYDLQSLTLKVEQYLLAGQMDEAVPLLNRVEELDPSSWIPHLLRGWAHARATRYKEAVNEYRLGLQKGGDPEKICPLLVGALLALGNISDAADLMADYYAKLPESVAVLSAYSEVTLRQGNLKLSRELLSKILRKEPYLYTANMNLAKILWSANERDEAVKCLRRVVQVYSVDVASRGLLGQYYLEKSQPRLAIPPLEQALPQVLSQPAAKERVSVMLTDAYVQVAASELEHGRFADAIDYCDKVLRLNPTALNALELKATSSVQLKQFRTASEALTKMASLQPNNPTITLTLGDVLYQDGQPAEARQQWQKALRAVAPADHDLRQAITDRLNGRISEETFK